MFSPNSYQRVTATDGQWNSFAHGYWKSLLNAPTSLSLPSTQTKMAITLPLSVIPRTDRIRNRPRGQFFLNSKIKSELVTPYLQSCRSAYFLFSQSWLQSPHWTFNCHKLRDHRFYGADTRLRIKFAMSSWEVVPKILLVVLHLLRFGFRQIARPACKAEEAVVLKLFQEFMILKATLF